MTILITGSGLIGTQIAKQFVESGETTIVYDIAPQLKAMAELIDLSKLKVVKGDILDFPNLVSTLKENHVERVVHTAAYLPSGLMRNLYNGTRVNVDGTLNVLEAMRLTDANRVVYTSTVGVYAKEGGQGDYFDEETSPMKPVSLYGATKMMSEYVGANYSKTYGIDFRVVRFANIIGPWSGDIQTNTGSFIRQLLESALNGKETRIDNPNPMVLDAEWLFSKDAALAVFLLMNKEKVANTVFNIGTGKTTKAEEIVDSIRDFVPNAKVSIGLGKPMAVKPLNIERAKNELGWSPKYEDTRLMIRDMIEWHTMHKKSPA